MKRICIIGDSWAGNVPPYQGIFERTLKPHGLEVINISMGGASNQGQLRLLEHQYLSQGHDFDHVVWFYVEPVRDFTEFVSLDYGDDTNAKDEIFPQLTYRDFYGDLEYMARQNFEHAKRLSSTHGTCFLVIGAGGVVPRSFDFTPEIKILCHSWNQEISALPAMPWNCFAHHVIRMADFAGSYDRSQVIEELDRLLMLEDVMKNDPIRYEDTYHPSLHYYPALGERIAQYIKDQQT